MLKCSTSLWSADLSNLGAEIRRVEPCSERFHLDVADGHYVKNLLFFPDQVKALRPHTRVPFEVHLMVTNPLDWIEPFVEAGADGFILGDDSWKQVAYTTERSLFGEEEKESNATVAEGFRNRLVQVSGFKQVPPPMPMRNSTGSIVYYLFFASQVKVAEKIVSEIFEKYRTRRDA